MLAFFIARLMAQRRITSTEMISRLVSKRFMVYTRGMGKGVVVLRNDRFTSPSPVAGQL